LVVFCSKHHLETETEYYFPVQRLTLVYLLDRIVQVAANSLILQTNRWDKYSLPKILVSIHTVHLHSFSNKV